MESLNSKDWESEDTNNPIEIFEIWFNEAKGSEPKTANTMALATVDRTGLPDVRIVLLKSFNKKGFVFFTNHTSTKGVEILSCPKAALCFYWSSLSKQVRIRGEVQTITCEEADTYFQSRPRGYQIGAWASQQSKPLQSYADLQKAFTEYSLKFSMHHVPRPDYWSGFRVIPLEIEFWHEGENRLHQRILFKKSKKLWEKTRLYP